MGVNSGMPVKEGLWERQQEVCVCVCVPLSFEQLSGAGQMARDGCDYELVIEGWHSVALTLCSLSPNYSLPEFGFIVKMFLFNYKCL